MESINRMSNQERLQGLVSFTGAEHEHQSNEYLQTNDCVVSLYLSNIQLVNFLHADTNHTIITCPLKIAFTV